jgi:hypothetical protein
MTVGMATSATHISVPTVFPNTIIKAQRPPITEAENSAIATVLADTFNSATPWEIFYLESESPSISPIDQMWSVTLASIAGVTRNV